MPLHPLLSLVVTGRWILSKKETKGRPLSDTSDEEADVGIFLLSCSLEIIY